MEARFAALEAENKTLRERVAVLEEAAKKPRAKKGPTETPAISKKVVDWGLIPVDSDLLFSLENKTTVVGKEMASFKDAKTIIPKDKTLLPEGKSSFGSINAWATACLKKYLTVLGRKTPSINVYEKKSGLSFKNAEGVFVSLSTIQSIDRAAPKPAPTSAAMMGGGGAQPAPVAASEDMAEIPASQNSQTGEDCWRCHNFVADGEECECEHIACLCGAIVVKEEYLGECVGCEKPLATCCGVLNDDQDPICHPCSKKAEEEVCDLEDMDVKGQVLLFNPITEEVFFKKADGTPGYRVSFFKDGKHNWDWNQKKIGDTFYKVNHFNYVMQTATAGGKWVGMYNPATKVLTPTPEPEDF